MVAHLPAYAAELEAYAQSDAPKDEVPSDDPQELEDNFGIGRVETPTKSRATGKKR